MHPTTHAFLRLLAFACLCALLPLLAACGGSSSDDELCDESPPPNTQPVDCHARPELCQ